MARNGRTERGGWVRTLTVDGNVADPVEDAYDDLCVLLALAWAHLCGNPNALRLGKETFAFIDSHLQDSEAGGYLETPTREATQRFKNTHMHLLEAFLAWHSVTGDAAHLKRARTDHRTLQAAFLRSRKAGRSASSSTRLGSRKPARREAGRSPATISNGRPCWSIMPRRAAG